MPDGGPLEDVEAHVCSRPFTKSIDPHLGTCSGYAVYVSIRDGTAMVSPHEQLYHLLLGNHYREFGAQYSMLFFQNAAWDNYFYADYNKDIMSNLEFLMECPRESQQIPYPTCKAETEFDEIKVGLLILIPRDHLSDAVAISDKAANLIATWWHPRALSRPSNN